jgi:putative SOS response-associated peptidase YedK
VAHIDEQQPKRKSLANIIFRSLRSSTFRSATTSHRDKTFWQSGVTPTGERSLDALRRGLIPNWAKDEKIAYKTIYGRVETVDTAPSYRQAFRNRRA